MLDGNVLSSLHSVYQQFSLWIPTDFSTPWICSATGWTGHRPIRLPLTNGQMWSSFTNHVLQNIPTSPVDFSEWAAEDSARGVLEEWFIGYVASACRDTVAAAVRTWYPQPDRLFSDHLVGWGLNAEIWRFLFQVGAMLTCFFYQWELL